MPYSKERSILTTMASFAVIPKNVKDPAAVATILMQLCTPIFETNKDKVICCPEQIAYYKNWISKDQLQERAKLLQKNNYGKYLQKVVEQTK